MQFEPASDRGDCVLLFLSAQRHTGFDTMPLCQAAPATRRRGVLRDEDGMTTQRCLPAIVARERRREPAPHEVTRMVKNHRFLFLEVTRVARPEDESASKARTRKRGEDSVEITQRRRSPEPRPASMGKEGNENDDGKGHAEQQKQDGAHEVLLGWSEVATTAAVGREQARREGA